MKISFAVAALLGYVTAINQKSGMDLEQTSEGGVEAYAEMGRFINSKGEPISLAQETGHARLVLQRTKKFTVPQDVTDLYIQNCDQHDAQSLSEAEIDDVTHCPINKDGTPIKAHIVQTNLEDNAYISEMYVGNPPQKVRGLFDTGSTNTWILNKNTTLPGGAEKEYSYDNLASTTSKKTDQKAIIQFGSGALAGHFYTDDIRLGSCDGTKSSGQIHIKNQKFGDVEKQKTIFTGKNFEAIVGMAYPALAEKGVKPVFDEMKDQKLLQDNMFSFYLTSKQAEENGIMSDLTFGYYDKSKFKGEINWAPVDYKYMYGVKLDDVKFNGKSTEVCNNRPGDKPCLITFDSGTSLMSVPKFATKNFMEHGIPTSNFIRKCDNEKQFGDMTLVIGGKDYNLSNEEWMFPAQKPSLSQGGQQMQFSMGPVGPQLMVQLSSESDLFNEDKIFSEEEKPSSKSNTQVKVDAGSDSERSKKRKHKSSLFDDDDEVADQGSGEMACASTIMTMDISHEMFLVGDVFMRKFYTIFDRDNDRVGLAEATTNDALKALNQK